MTSQNVVLLIFVIGIAIIPAIVIFDRLSRWWDYRNKKRKIAAFIEQSADKQIKAKDGPI
jgi:hypothetical protein